VKALLRVDDKKELSDPPRVQEKELKDASKPESMLENTMI
jgi:hypothetical protein